MASGDAWNTGWNLGTEIARERRAQKQGRKNELWEDRRDELKSNIANLAAKYPTLRKQDAAGNWVDTPESLQVQHLLQQAYLARDLFETPPKTPGAMQHFEWLLHLSRRPQAQSVTTQTGETGTPTTGFAVPVTPSTPPAAGTAALASPGVVAQSDPLSLYAPRAPESPAVPASKPTAAARQLTELEETPEPAPPVETVAALGVGPVPALPGSQRTYTVRGPALTRKQLKQQAQANLQAGQEANMRVAGAPTPLNEFVQLKNQMEAAGFSGEDIATALRAKAGLLQKDSTETERFISNFKTEHPGATDEDALRAYTQATAKPTTPKGLKVITLGGIPAYVRDQDAGQDYYPDAKGNFSAGTPADVVSAFNAEAQSAKAKEARDDQKRQDEEAFQESMAEIRERIHDREQALAESSKIPSTEANRYTQAQILKEQTATLREMLDDPDVSQYMGPVAGHTYGYVASLYSKKIRDLFVAQKSLSALLPILHGYRGGAQTQATFDNMSGNMAIDVNAYQGTLDAIDKLADNIEKEVQADYPNAPMFKGGGQTPAPTPGPANLGGSKGSRSLAAAMTLAVNKGKTETEVEQDLIAHGYTVTRP